VRTCFIFNPHSGANRRRPGLRDLIRAHIRERALPAELATTERPGHATELARAAAQSGHDVVVAVGGDGTVNEIAQGLVGTATALALVPCGSGNGLALHLGLPRQPEAALSLASGAGAEVRLIDTGEVNGRPFVNAMGLGLDAEISRRFNRLRRRGLLGYVLAGAAALRAHQPFRCHITAGAAQESLDLAVLAVANSDQYGNHARIAPGARVDDGQLDLVGIRAVGLVAAVALVPRLFLGTLEGSRHVVRWRGARFQLERPAAGLIHTDGETHQDAARLDVVVRPRSLRLLVPARPRAALTRSVPASRFALQFP
jgi:YegS/Rv2252/BmrU family lipid kinase